MSALSQHAPTEHQVPRGGHQLYVREYPGDDPAIILMHGFPDNHHLYDRLLPFLSGRHIVTFDFLGWGQSDKPHGYPYTSFNQTGDLDAVIAHLRLNPVVLVAHDASGPPAIEWALDHADRVAGLVLLNTYYNSMPTLRPPEAIALFSTPRVRSVARVVAAIPGVFRSMYFWQVGRFIRDRDVRREMVPLLYEQFTMSPSAQPAFYRLNTDLEATVRRASANVPRMQSFRSPVRIIFGAKDPYLNVGVARRFHELFPTSELHIVPTARHFVQLDEPQEVARLLLQPRQTRAEGAA